jgi:hypothetical protein
MEREGRKEDVSKHAPFVFVPGLLSLSEIFVQQPRSLALSTPKPDPCLQSQMSPGLSKAGSSFL